MSAPETLRDALLHDYYASDDVRSTVGYSLGDRLDAIIAAARAESDALRAAIATFLSIGYPNGTDHPADWYADDLRRAALAPSPAEPAAPEREP